MMGTSQPGDCTKGGGDVASAGSLTAPVVGHHSPPTQPAGVPAARRQDPATQPIAMRATPSSYKVMFTRIDKLLSGCMKVPQPRSACLGSPILLVSGGTAWALKMIPSY